MISESLHAGDGVAQRDDWGTAVRILVTEAEALAEAESLARTEMAEVASACSRFSQASLTWYTPQKVMRSKFLNGWLTGREPDIPPPLEPHALRAVAQCPRLALRLITKD